MRRITRHFVPHPENNYRALLLHPFALSFYVFVLVALQVALGTLSRVRPEILGISTKISSQEVITLTNQQRQGMGIAPLSENELLDRAALAKGEDMVAKNYWAHISPDGKTPWVFISGTGYKYISAGENLARDFSDAPAVVSAWMASKSHRENLLDPNFKEIGVAVLDSNIGGVNGVLIVQEFGQPQFVPGGPSPQKIAPKVVGNGAKEVGAVASAQNSKTSGVDVNYKLNPFTVSRTASAVVVGLVSLLLVVDFFVIRRKGILRPGSINWSHMAALSFVMFMIWYFSAGGII